MNNLSANYPLQPADLFRDRSGQWIAAGVPAELLQKALAEIDSMWHEGPGGWAYEFSALAASVENENNFLLAALLYGIAKYPVPINAYKKKAYFNQLKAYLKASEKFDFRFERKVALIPYRGITTPVAYHVFYASDPKNAPVILHSGGIDTYKMDIHNFSAAVGHNVPATMVLIDIPGTGESQVLLAPDNDEIYRGIIDIARSIGNGKLGYYGNSFGAYWAVRLAIEGSIDFGVAVGAPLNKAYLPHENSLMRPDLGMNGVFSFTLGLDEVAPADELWRMIGKFSLEKLGIWNNDSRVPLFLVNGSD
ncbi:MAG: alpha/beta hydrolase, partial [Bacteroidota bacterium]